MEKNRIEYLPHITQGFYDKINKLEESNFINDLDCKFNYDVIYNDERNNFDKIVNINCKMNGTHYINDMITINYNFSSKQLNYSCKYCKREDEKKACHHVAHIIDCYNEDKIKRVCRNNDIDNLYLNLIEEKNVEYIEKQRRRVNDSIKSFRKYIRNKEILPLKEKVILKPVIEIKTNDINSFLIDLSLKIGNNKFYQIKNINDFVERVRYCIEHSYSKNFSFIHNPKNFSDESIKLINELTELFLLNKNEYVKNKSIEITPYFLEKIIGYYKNCFVEVIINNNEFEAYISDDEIEVPFKIDESRIKVKGFNKLLFIPGFYNDYLIDNNIIKKIKADDDERELIRFYNYNKKFSFEYAEDDFVKEIYSRYSDYIEVEDEFKKQHDLSDINIDVFFDIENDVLKQEAKFQILKDNKSIEVSEFIVNEKYNSNKYLKYKSFIESLGFSNGAISNVNDIGRFLVTDFEKFKNVANIYLSENIKKMQVKKLPKTTMSLGYNTGMLSICFDELNFSNDELLKILNGIKKKVKYVKLNKDTIIDVNSIEAEKLANVVDEFKLDTKKLAEKQIVPLYQSLKLLSKTEEFCDYKTDDVLKKILFDISNYKSSEFDVPVKLKDYMRDYQIDAYKWMKTLVKYNFCGILADDMGLGKTLEIISLIESDNINKPSLIVCPKSLSFNWLSEFNKWNSDLDVFVVRGTVAERKSIIESIDECKKSIYITSYDSLKNDLDYYNNIKFRFMILDEAQFIKNHTTLKAQSVKQISSELRFVLTGTPIENTVVDLWSIFDFLMPNYLYNYSVFKNQYEKEITVNSNNDVIRNLVKKITPFILRRTKEEVLKDLPEKIEIIRYAEMGEAQRKVYEAQILKTKEIIKNKVNKIELLSQLTRLRQICVDPRLFIDDYNGDSAKVEVMINLINDYVKDGHKVLVFSQFTSVFPELERSLDELGIKYFKITGKTDAFDRVQMSQEFNKEESLEKVFFVSLKAGGTGLNLVGADIVIHLDPWWNISAENQATDRAYRIGQKNVVKVIKLICENSIEQKVLDLQEAKKQVINSVIADNDDNIVKLSDDDLYYLLS